MKVGIDARMFGPSAGGGGLGRYVEQFVTRLPDVDKQNHYVLFTKTNVESSLEQVRADIHWYTFKEQLFLGRLIDKQNLDLVHFPHWNVPIFLKTPFVVTIHDLILLEQPKSAVATTRNPLFYTIKYWAYKLALWNAITRSKRIITVSEYTKQAILKYFPKIDAEKITVIYEGLTDLGIRSGHGDRAGIKPALTIPYLLSVGNSYPHKNLPRLIQAFEQIAPLFPDLRLVVAGRKDVFFDRLDQLIHASPFAHRIDHTPNPTDHDLASLYTNASLFVFPSLSEGFGLPPLEAMQFQVPVVSSNATCLPEILGDAAVYFNPESVDAMARAITDLLNNPGKQAELRKKGLEQIKRYDWNTMTRQIVSLYTHCVNE